MTTTTKQTYTLHYSVSTTYVVEVERDADISEEALLSSITRDELAQATEGEDVWGNLKEAWRAAEPRDGSVYITDAEGTPLYE